MKKYLVLPLFLLTASHGWAATRFSDGCPTEGDVLCHTAPHAPANGTSIKALQDISSNGDTITIPAGTFNWSGGVNIDKGITISGQTTTDKCGTMPKCTSTPNPGICNDTDGATFNDVSTIVDEKTPRSGSGLINFNVAAGTGVGMRVTGITFRHSLANPDQAIQSGAAIRLRSNGGLINRVRVDHCHFFHLSFGYQIQIGGLVYGVEDHNFEEVLGGGLSRIVQHDEWGGSTNGNGSWAES